MKSTIGNDRTDLARIAVDTFVAASLACMENPDSGSPVDGQFERPIALAQHGAREVDPLWQSLPREVS